MEFTKLRQSTYFKQQTFRKANDKGTELSPPQDSTPAQTLKEVLIDIQEINIAKSFVSQKLRQGEHTNVSSKSNSHHSSELIIEIEHRVQEPCTPQKQYNKPQIRKSLIFSPSLFANNKQPSGHPQSSQIRIHYFDLPACKNIVYDQKTTISQLITLALNAYLTDQKLDSSKIKNKNPLNYELRLLLDEDSYKADMSIQAISYDRLISENIFDALVLLVKGQQKKRKMSSKTQSLQFFRQSAIKNTTLIRIFNELGQQLGVLDMQRSDSLQKIFDFVQNNDFHNMRTYFLTENLSDDHGLPRDFEIRNLQSNTVYIKTKKYIDQSQNQLKNTRPVRGLTVKFNPQRSSSRAILPIGLKQASQYEQFKVIKINSMGVQQERILGIDQTKIYNYKREIRQQGKKISFFSKLFGADKMTGTKRPFRLIEDIMDVREMQNGFVLQYQQKTIKFLVESAQEVNRIMRKLKFLMHHCRDESIRMSRSQA